MLAFALGLALVLLPVAARNYAVTGGFYLTTSQFGPNFYIGNNPAADGTYMSLRPGRGAPEFERQDATELAERARQRSLTPGEVSSVLDRTGHAPSSRAGRRDWLALVGRKFALLWNRGEMLDTESQESYEEVSPVLRVLGAGRPLRRRRAAGARRSDRRVARSPPAVAALRVVRRLCRERRPASMCSRAIASRWCRSSCCWRPTVCVARTAIARRGVCPRVALRLAVVVAIVAVAVNWPMLSSTRMRAITETNLGTALHEASRYDEAVEHYRKATALQPDYAPAYNNLGVTLRAPGPRG